MKSTTAGVLVGALVVQSLLLGSIWAEGTIAQPSTTRSQEVMQLRVNRQAARIPPLTQREILGSVRAARGVSGGSIGLRRGRGQGLQRGLQDLRSSPPIVRRSLPNLWQLELPADVSPDDIQVNYRMVSDSGRTGWMSAERGLDGEIRTHLRPNPIRVLRRTGDRQWLEGGVTLEMDLSSAGVSGRYRGRIEILVTQL